MNKVIWSFIANALLLFLVVASSLCNAQQMPSVERQKLAFDIALVKTEIDLKNYLKMTPRAKSAFRHFSLADKKIFLDSLVFTKNGLGSFNYGVLISKLKEEQVREVTTLFGLQHQSSLIFFNATTSIAPGGGDTKDTKCNTTAWKCESSMFDICTSNCKAN